MKRTMAILVVTSLAWLPVPARAMNEVEGSMILTVYILLGKQLYACLEHLRTQKNDGATATVLRDAYDQNEVCAIPRGSYPDTIKAYRRIPEYLKDMLTNDPGVMMLTTGYDAQQLMREIEAFLSATGVRKAPAGGASRSK